MNATTKNLISNKVTISLVFQDSDARLYFGLHAYFDRSHAHHCRYDISCKYFNSCLSNSFVYYNACCSSASAKRFLAVRWFLHEIL